MHVPVGAQVSGGVEEKSNGPTEGLRQSFVMAVNWVSVEKSAQKCHVVAGNNRVVW